MGIRGRFISLLVLGALFGAVSTPDPATGTVSAPAIQLIAPVELGYPPIVSDKPRSYDTHISFQAWSGGTGDSDYRVSFVVEGGGFRAEGVDLGMTTSGRGTGRFLPIGPTALTP